MEFLLNNKIFLPVSKLDNNRHMCFYDGKMYCICYSTYFMCFGHYLEHGKVSLVPKCIYIDFFETDISKDIVIHDKMEKSVILSLESDFTDDSRTKMEFLSVEESSDRLQPTKVSKKGININPFSFYHDLVVFDASNIFKL